VSLFSLHIPELKALKRVQKELEFLDIIYVSMFNIVVVCILHSNHHLDEKFIDFRSVKSRFCTKSEFSLQFTVLEPYSYIEFEQVKNGILSKKRSKEVQTYG